MDFDASKTFDENLQVFRAELDAIDPQCSALLFQHIGMLREASDPKDREARGAFNSAILADLPALPSKDGGEN